MRGKKMKKQVEQGIDLQRIERTIAQVEVKGTAPLIVHAWSAKAKQMILDKQQGRKPQKELKDPEADYQSSMYRMPDGGHGFPVLGFKAATVGGARYFNGVTMTQMRQAMFFIGDPSMPDLVRLKCSEPTMREDMVRLNGQTADIRYRAEYRDWGAVLQIQYIPSVISLDAIVALVDAGGMGGVGEWRPEKDGAFGTYEVVGA
jgi:hypothetical protein